MAHHEWNNKMQGRTVSALSPGREGQLLAISFEIKVPNNLEIDSFPRIKVKESTPPKQRLSITTRCISKLPYLHAKQVEVKDGSKIGLKEIERVST